MLEKGAILEEFKMNFRESEEKGDKCASDPQALSHY
jgi:hypothetical protein